MVYSLRLEPRQQLLDLLELLLQLLEQPQPLLLEPQCQPQEQQLLVLVLEPQLLAVLR